MLKKTLFYLFLFFSVGINAQSFDYNTISKHPRLLLKAGEEEAIKKEIARYPELATIHERILDTCRTVMTLEPVKRIKEGKRLLGISRIALRRIFYLSYAYRMTGNSDYAHRAEKEMIAVSNFKDWNPSHFLDVGEMVMALAIGYDWLNDVLQPETKALVCQAIEKKGFDAAKNTKDAWFYERSNNWNSVCNGGLVFGALAIFEDLPDYSKAIIEKCILTNPQAMESYGPDGGYPEGFGYWGYGTSFQVMLTAALQSSFGNDHGISKAPGFLQSARFMQYMTAPSGDCYCFSDAERTAESNPMMYWFANQLHDNSILWLEKEYLKRKDMVFAEDRLLPCLMIFSSKIDLKKVKAPKNHFWYNGGHTPVFIYRGGWSKKEDAYLGVKGGSPSTSHAHMDAGSFVYEKNGVRWAMDLGMQSYITLESKGVDLWNQKQDGQRWDVFRLSNVAHGTLTINKERHLVDSFAPITQVFKSKHKKGAEVDLSSVFANSVKQAVRTVTLDKEDNLTVTDQIETGDKEAQIMWVMVTPTNATVKDDHSIELEQNGKRMLLVVHSPYPVKMSIWSNVPPHDYDFKNPGTCRVGFEVNMPAKQKDQLVVKLIPVK